MTDPDADRDHTDVDATGEPASEASGPVRLSRNIKVLGAVSLAQDTGSEMLYHCCPRSSPACSAHPSWPSASQKASPTQPPPR